MDHKKDLEILIKLAEGIDPFTGEVFEKDSPYQNADMVRALHRAIEALSKAARRSERQKNLPIRAGKPWDKAESDMLVKKFGEGVNIAELASQHQRTTGAIESQLIKLGKLPPRNYIKKAESLED